ncbi:MAG TPA: hypothetical protein VG167_06665 [Verrucomicrobiae bacterium]|nr:hypothetical protein [Verrucomicrobiae bacterium]
MIPSSASLVTDPLFLLALASALGLIGYLTVDAVRDMLQNRRERRVREQARRQFWGYE